MRPLGWTEKLRSPTFGPARGFIEIAAVIVRPYLGRTPRPEGAALATSARSMFCLLDVAGTPCALPRSAVREILPLPHLYPPPASGGPLAGFLNLGGRPIPVLDLARLLGLRGEPHEGDPYRHVLLAADGDVALLVDRVVDVVEAAPDAVRPVDGRHTLNGCVETEIAIGDRLVHGLSLERMLTAEERERVASLTRQAAERLAALEATPTA